MSTNQTAKNPVPIPDEKKDQLRKLTKVPSIAWPTIFLLFWIVGGVVTTDILALQGVIPLWVAAVLNVLWMYPVFHVGHDALHRAVSSNRKLNDWAGRIALFFTVPEVALSSFRYAHMIHHRYTNADQDPDHYIFGSNWATTVLRWMTFEFNYAYLCMKADTPAGKKAFRVAVPAVLATVAVFSTLCVLGYWQEAIFLWLIPSRITLGLIAFVFLWMPHLSDDRGSGLSHIHAADSSLDNLTAGTTMRLGNEWLLAPLTQWHNYHLIHHLWPTTPSYRHARVWKLLEPELRERDLNIQHGFSLKPTFHPAGTTAVSDYGSRLKSIFHPAATNAVGH